MIQKFLRITCDICGKEEYIPNKKTEVPYKDRWKDFVLGDLYKMQMENRDPSNICPQCAERIERFIYAMTKEFKNGGPE